MKRLSQLEAWGIFTIELKLPLKFPKDDKFDADAFVEQLVRRGLVRREGAQVMVTDEGRAAMKRWERSGLR